jgi:hypothetical protein
MNKQLEAMKLIVRVPIKSVKPVSQAKVLALLEYVRLRRWEYTTYEGIEKLAQADNERHIKRLLLDENLKITTHTCKPICVMYQYKKHVAAYVMVSSHTQKLIGMSELTVSKIPTSIIKE